MSSDGNTTPGSFEGLSLGVSLTVKDVRASLAWYRDVFGFTVVREMEHEGKLRGVMMKAGAVEILLNQDDGARGWERTKGEGFSLRIRTAQSVDEVAARIRAAGGTLDREPADMPWGARMFVLRDPDGYRFAISS
jgi:uncharacterized glyoxalase superfamily protein PhnB